MMNEFVIGDKVSAIYKTGKYLGEITDIRSQHYLIRVLAVAKHPMQGDLHHPKDANVDFFHQRRALAYREQTNVPKQMVKPYTDALPEYIPSLKEAVENLKLELQEQATPWANQSLQLLIDLEKEYYN